MLQHKRRWADRRACTIFQASITPKLVRAADRLAARTDDNRIANRVSKSALATVRGLFELRFLATAVPSGRATAHFYADLLNKMMLESLKGKQVVIDVQAQYVFVGQLERVDEKSVELTNVDVHDLRDSNTTRERYLLDTRKDGIHTNRRRVFVQRPQIVSVSALDDILL